MEDADTGGKDHNVSQEKSEEFVWTVYDLVTRLAKDTVKLDDVYRLYS